MSFSPPPPHSQRPNFINRLCRLPVLIENVWFIWTINNYHVTQNTIASQQQLIGLLFPSDGSIGGGRVGSIAPPPSSELTNNFFHSLHCIISVSDDDRPLPPPSDRWVWIYCICEHVARELTLKKVLRKTNSPLTEWPGSTTASVSIHQNLKINSSNQMIWLINFRGEMIRPWYYGMILRLSRL